MRRRRPEYHGKGTRYRYRLFAVFKLERSVRFGIGQSFTVDCNVVIWLSALRALVGNIRVETNEQIGAVKLYREARCGMV